MVVRILATTNNADGTWRNEESVPHSAARIY